MTKEEFMEKERSMKKLIKEHNDIVLSYSRCKGELPTINLDTEDKIEKLATGVLSIVKELNTVEAISLLKEEKKAEYIRAFDVVEKQCNYSLETVKKSRDFMKMWNRGKGRH